MWKARKGGWIKEEEDELKKRKIDLIKKTIKDLKNRVN